MGELSFLSITLTPSYKSRAKPNLISRFLTSPVLKEFDTVDQKIEKTLQIFPAAFALRRDNISRNSVDLYYFSSKFIIFIANNFLTFLN